MKLCNAVVLTFVITALWDVVLRKMSENFTRLPKFLQFDFVEYLIPYFQKHTLLAAALIAGFVGSTTQIIILSMHSFPTTYRTLLSFIGVTFVVSALYGLLMKFSGLFPHLVDTYYKNLGTPRSMYLDGVSGVIVQTTMLVIYYLLDKK